MPKKIKMESWKPAAVCFLIILWFVLFAQVWPMPTLIVYLTASYGFALSRERNLSVIVAPIKVAIFLLFLLVAPLHNDTVTFEIKD